jgi:xanthine dehydrogenase accessory factor
LSDLTELVSVWDQEAADGKEVALATIVRVEGSSYRKPGARMLTTTAGVRVGTISGGCLEKHVAKRIWWLTRNGARIQRFSTTLEENATDGYGLGCGGAIHLFFERHSGAAALTLQTLKSVLT